ncbi:22093_t:CDS:2 [Cetraspora pellucida]|uniref:22093_t:CDS:1 n=1 Tax=Cetraspora pellucida TaxID=1433469 RepID=A0A9N9HH36_9GLOM|nr:22093_t:CDS:2 [Cetraspora pellucida]
MQNLFFEPAQTAVKQYEFCQVHRREEIIISYGIEKEYPLHLDFTILPNRVRSLKDELLKIIKEQQYSEYHVNAVKKIQEMGVSKANSSLLQINYFELSQLRYYGTKGLAIILETLTEILIVENFNNISLDTAKKIIIDSIEFELYVYDNDDNTEK